MRTSQITESIVPPIKLEEVKGWLSLSKDECHDDDLIENQIIPVAIELFENHSGRNVGITSIEEIHESWPDRYDFRYRPVLEVCGLWSAKDNATWTEVDLTEWVVDVAHEPPLLRPACLDTLQCKCVDRQCCECPTRWRVNYLSGQGACSIRACDKAWINYVIAEMYRVREASLETKFFETAAFRRINQATWSPSF